MSSPVCLDSVTLITTRDDTRFFLFVFFSLSVLRKSRAIVIARSFVVVVKKL